jgi:hypothetical protein
MKLRIRGNSIRLRLTQGEVAELAERGWVSNETDFGRGQTLEYKLRHSETASKVGAAFNDGAIDIVIPEALVREWSATEKVSISATTETLQLLIEKDFKCLTPRGGDDDDDTFPHPKETNAEC